MRAPIFGDDNDRELFLALLDPMTSEHAR